MKFMKIIGAAALATGMACSADVSAAVKQPAIKPTWSGAKPAVWTMDYKTAFDKAAAGGKYTVVLFSGMWWCPYCQDMEKNVLSTSAWKNYAKTRGFYEVAMDYPSRTGDSRWCWLWETSYRKAARLTAEEAAGEIAERLGFQGEIGTLLGSTSVRTATNYVVEVTGKGKNLTTNMTLYAAVPTTSYNELNYGNLVVFDPAGNIAGRVDISYAYYDETGKKIGTFYPEYKADPVGYVTSKIDEIINPGAVKSFVGNWVLGFADGAGYAAISAKIGTNGKTVLSGWRGDGSRVSAAVNFVTGAEKCVLPIAFNKKDGTVFTVELYPDGTVVSNDLPEGMGELSFAGVASSLPEKFVLSLLDFPKEIGGAGVVAESLPDGAELAVKGVTISGSGVKLTYAKKTGLVTGSFKVAVVRSNGRQAKVNVSVTGAFQNGGARLTVLPKGGEASAATLSVPDEEEEGCDECFEHD